MMNDLFDDLKFDFSIDEKPNPKPQKGESIKVTHRMSKREDVRKFTSERSLEDALDWQFENGVAYHCLSWGDVDSFSYLKHVAKQQKINYVGISTWVCGGNDITEIERLYDLGIIKRCDFFVGEMFKSSYPEAWSVLKDFIKKENGRLCVFRNHSKIMMIKGEKFDCVIESSANMLTNPRTEQTVITVDTALTNWFIKIFGEIKPFNKDYGAKPFIC